MKGGWGRMRRKENSMTLTSHPHVVYSCSYLSKHEFRDTLSRDAHIYFSRRNRRVLHNPCYHSWKYHDRNCCGMFGRRTSSLLSTSDALCVCMYLNIANDTRCSRFGFPIRDDLLSSSSKEGGRGSIEIMAYGTSFIS